MKKKILKNLNKKPLFLIKTFNKVSINLILIKLIKKNININYIKKIF